MTPPPDPILRALCVDGCRDAADALGAVLAIAGFAARVCYGGPDAVTAPDEFRPDVCLIDLKASRADGLELARRVRAWAGGRTGPGPGPWTPGGTAVEGVAGGPQELTVLLARLWATARGAGPRSN
jgi:CheY-like chemotaxis protein